MDFESLRIRLFQWLPIFIILMILMGIILYAARTVLPRVQSYQDLSDQVDAQRATVGTLVAAQADNNNIVILQHQIDNAMSAMDSASTIFLTKRESEQVLDRLYAYAYSRGVRVTTLQAQQPAQEASTDAPYETALYQLQVTGGIANLIDFVARFQEASLPSVNIVSMSIARSNDQALLTMGLLIYTSKYASGEALDGFPTPLPTLTPSNTPTPTPTPTETLTPTPTPTTTIVIPTATWTPSEAPPTLTPSETLTPTETLTPSLTPTPAPTRVDCPGAPGSLFREGDIAIVHFNQLGALRLLSDPNATVLSTRTQAYDNDRLEIIAGPVCGEGKLYWYVRNTTRGNALGWSAEAEGTDRYMCPEANPECIG